MSQILMGAAALFISVSLVFCLSVIAFQVTGPMIAKMVTGTFVVEFSMPAFFQNLGIASGLVGATFRNIDLLTVAVLLIALAMAVKKRASPELHRTIEIPLLVSGLAAFGSLGIVRLVA